MAFRADYPGAIVVEAANYGYGVPNRPKTWGFHTPEEPADTYPSTPEYLRTTDRDASYTYFVSSWLALAFQLVPESEGAYAHGLEGKPAPHWSDGTNLNLQSLSLSFEGHAATIHRTMPRGCPQWVAGVNLVAHRTKALGLNLNWAFQHKQVSIYRGDCGQFDQAAFIADVKAKIQEEHMAKFIKIEGSDTVYVTDGIFYWTVRDNRHLQELVDGGLVPPGSAIISSGLFSRLIEARDSVVASGSLGEAQVRQIVRQEIDKTKLKA